MIGLKLNQIKKERSNNNEKKHPLFNYYFVNIKIDGKENVGMCII